MLRRVFPQLQRAATLFSSQHRATIRKLSGDANLSGLNEKLRIAVEKGDSADLVKRLLDFNADPNAVKIDAKHDDNVKYKVPLVFYVLDKYKWCTYSDKEKVIPKTIGLQLIDRANLSHVNFQHPISGMTALHGAAMHIALYDDLDFLKRLLEKNANPHLETFNLKSTPLQLLNRAYAGKTRVIELANQLLIDAMIKHPLTTGAPDLPKETLVPRYYSMDNMR